MSTANRSIGWGCAVIARQRMGSTNTIFACGAGGDACAEAAIGFVGYFPFGALGTVTTPFPSLVPRPTACDSHVGPGNGTGCDTPVALRPAWRESDPRGRDNRRASCQRAAWLLLLPVGLPTPRHDSPCEVFVAALLRGSRFFGATGALQTAAATYSRDLSTKPHPASLADLAVPSALAAGPLHSLVAAGAPGTTPPQQPTRTMFGVPVPSTTSKEDGPSPYDHGLGPTARLLPHAEHPLPALLSPFRYHQLHLLLTLAYSGRHSITFVARGESGGEAAQAAAAVVALTGLIYPFRWQGTVHTHVTAANCLTSLLLPQLPVTTSLAPLSAVASASTSPQQDDVLRGDSPLLCSIPPSLVPVALLVAPAASRSGNTMWLADCATGVVAPAVPHTSPPIEVLPHNAGLKDRWKRARSELQPSQHRHHHHHDPHHGAGYQSMDHGPGLLLPVPGNGIGDGGVPSREKVLLAALDTPTTLLGSFRSVIVRRPGETTPSVALEALLRRSLGVQHGGGDMMGGGLGVGMAAPGTGHLLFRSLLESRVIQRSTEEVAEIQGIIDVLQAQRVPHPAEAPATMRHWCAALLYRCAETFPNDFADLHSPATAAKRKSSGGTPFSAVASLLKQAKQTIRMTPEPAMLAPTAVGFTRVARGGGGDPGARADALYTAGTCLSPASDTFAALALIQTNPAAAAVVATNAGLRHGRTYMVVAPSTKRSFEQFYTMNRDHLLRDQTTQFSSGRGASVSLLPAAQLLPHDALDSFGEYHGRVCPAAGFGPTVQSSQGGSTVLRTAVPLATPEGSTTPSPSAGSTSTYRHRAVLDLSHLLGGRSRSGSTQPSPPRNEMPTTSMAADGLDWLVVGSPDGGRTPQNNSRSPSVSPSAAAARSSPQISAGQAHELDAFF